ncbi:hypothetical protein [Chloroflexus sp.]|uniref:hypothetical protein n=1 Tax=Chloroflexus sp. TaxID=1904827 RepID=UPI0026127CBD|nr:hypothetical protein [uncultured Chloroflexus sp.]
MSDLLGAIGQAWPRLLCYPGGVSAALAALLLARLRGVRLIDPPSANRLIDLILPLGAISLLPLPLATTFPYSLDLPTALTLLIWPGLRRAATERHSAHQLSVYLPLVLGGIALSSATATFDLGGLLRWPAEPTRQATLLLGAAAWIVAVPRIAPPSPDAAMVCSGLGLMLIGTLPLIAALNATPLADSAPAWLIAALAVCIATGALIGAGRLPEWAVQLLAGLALVSAGVAAVEMR